MAQNAVWSKFSVSVFVAPLQEGMHVGGMLFWSFTRVKVGHERGLFDTARSKRVPSDCQYIGGTIHVSSFLQKEALRITKVLVE